MNLTQLAQAKGQTNLDYLNSQFDQLRPTSFKEGDQDIFEYYGKHNTENWASNFDFSGVAFDHVKSGTLITNQHIVVAWHYQRDIGQRIWFFTKDGNELIERTVVATAALKDYDSRLGDACIQKLNAPVPEGIKIYKILDAIDFANSSSIVGAPYLVTDKEKRVFANEIYSFYNAPNAWDIEELVSFWKKNDVPSFMFHGAVGGDSGSPHFLIVDGELVLGSVLYGGSYDGTKIGHFLGHESMQLAITKGIEDMKND